MTFTEDLLPYSDPATHFVGLGTTPDKQRTQNGILFTSEALMLLYLRHENATPLWEQFKASLGACRIFDGCYARTPGDKESSSWDDHLGAAVVSRFYDDSAIAKEIHAYGVMTDFDWPGHPLWAIPIFQPTLRAAAQLDLNLWDQVKVAFCFIQNCFEKWGQTSGICLLYLAQQVHYGRHLIPDLAIQLWRFVMLKRYGSMRKVYEIYFQDPHHPFALYGPEGFE